MDWILIIMMCALCMNLVAFYIGFSAGRAKQKNQEPLDNVEFGEQQEIKRRGEK